MIRHWLRLLPLFIAALWLPLAAVAAVAMPFCRHGEAPAPAQTDMGSSHHHCHDAEGDEPGSAPDSTGATVSHGSGSCDSCGFCHLACAAVVPMSATTTGVIPAAQFFGLTAAALHPDHIPELLQPPPRTI
jgi:hypothetical protein